MTPIGGNVQAYCCSTDKLHSLQVNYKIIDWVIWEEVRVAINISASFNNSERIIQVTNQIQEKDNLMKKLKDYIETLKQKQDKLVSLYLDNNIDKGIYESRYKEMTQEMTKCHTEYNLLSSQINELEASLHSDSLIDNKPVLADKITNFKMKQEYVREYVKDVILEKKDNEVEISIKWLKSLILPRSTYLYVTKGGVKKLWRLNEDKTKDLLINKRGKD